MGWIDQRLPVFSFLNKELGEYPTPRNLNYLWNFGSLAGITLVIMILTGIFLAMHYTPQVDMAFDSVERIMREVNYGWLIRYIHMNGASMFFIVVYIHIFRGLFYGSYKSPRELLWILGVVILLLMMATAFMGYVLPWGQMSYWGATVITNLFSAIPFMGDHIVTWLWGGFSVDNPTLNRFFVLHYLFPFLIVAVVGLHLIALHSFGSNNPLGIERTKPEESIPFHPYYTVHDLIGVSVFLMIFSAIIFFAPEMGGYFLEYNNFIPADSLKTPAHIAPVWYFTPYYSMLRGTTNQFMYVLAFATAGYVALVWFGSKLSGLIKAAVAGLAAVLIIGFLSIDAKFWGVVVMGASVMIFFALPWLDQSPVRSIRYRPQWHKVMYGLFVVFFVVLGYFGIQPPSAFGERFSQVGTLFYFGFFLLMPWWSKRGDFKPLPNRVTFAPH